MKGFTLIEVLIATMILVIASISFLDFSNNSKNMFSFLNSQNIINLKSTVILNTKNPKKNMYENLIDFKIDNDNIIHSLKKDKFNFSSNLDSSQKIENFKLVINQQKIYDKHHQSVTYQVQIK